MDKQSFLAYARSTCSDRPDLHSEIQEIFELAVYEISDGASPVHEWELATDAVADLLAEESTV